MVRRALDRAYVFSGYCAGACLFVVGALIVAQIAGRLLDIAVDATELSGFSMAAMTFFGLAYVYRTGSHIRIDFVVRRLGDRARKAFEIWCCGAATALLGYWSYWTILMVWKSVKYGDISQGLVGVPLWIPQVPMAVGSVLLTVAVGDSLVGVVRGTPPRYEEIDEEEIARLHGARVDPTQAPGPVVARHHE